MLQEKQREHFSDLTKDSYGSSEKLARILDLGIEMLFYLEEDTFEKRDVQSVVSAIRTIIRILRRGEDHSVNPSGKEVT